MRSPSARKGFVSERLRELRRTAILCSSGILPGQEGPFAALSEMWRAKPDKFHRTTMAEFNAKYNKRRSTPPTCPPTEVTRA
jgi:hypothetical protein